MAAFPRFDHRHGLQEKTAALPRPGDQPDQEFCAIFTHHSN